MRVSSIFEEDSPDSGSFNNFSSGRTQERRNFRANCHIAASIHKNPSIVALPLGVLAIFCAIGVAIILTIVESEENIIRNDALILAVQTGQYFDHYFHQTLLPLFSLSLFVDEIDDFQSLAGRIGPAYGPNSLPFISKQDDSPNTHRNVTAVCDDPELLNRFNKIAEKIKRNSKLERILVNLQLAPHGVVCMVHPLNNTKDFDPPIFMDNSGAVGHDLMTDPARSFMAKLAVKGDDIKVAGPLELVQCNDCHPTVKQAFIARLPVSSSKYVMTVDGKNYNRWGLAVALINWDALIEETKIFHQFEERGYEFQLTRLDRRFNEQSRMYDEKVIVLAESANFVPDAFVVSNPLDTTNEEWVISISYNKCDWIIWAVVACGIVSFCIALLFCVILFQKQLHTDLEEEKASLLLDQAKQIARREREQELNEYISHEVRNPLSAAISACNFIAASLEDFHLKSSEDFERKDSIAEDVSIIESSLTFINDILRSILDIHKTASNQMTLKKTTVDILNDIFEPVSSMIYQRDATFKIILDCPDGLVVHSDRLRLQQVILNLSRNAAKFVQSGFIKLRAVTSSEGTVCISVEDSGPGISLAMRPRMFCKFNSSLDVTGQGTGLGLSLCKSLVSLMGGEIYLDEVYESGLPSGPGTRIVVDLKQPPITIGVDECAESVTVTERTDVTTENGVQNALTSQTANSTGVTDTDESNRSQDCSDDLQCIALPDELSVLFVDDDRILRKLAARSISKVLPNWKVREAASGETVLQLIDTSSFDIIFMDQYMTSVEQSLKGTETTRALRARGVNSLICGLSANDCEESFLRAGADAFIMKPFPCKEEELMVALSNVLNSKRLHHYITIHKTDEDKIPDKLEESFGSWDKSVSNV